MTTNTMMTSWTDGAETGPSLLDRLTAPFGFVAEFRRNLRIRFEMSRISDRNLADMGLTRADIQQIARGENVQRRQAAI